MNFTNIVIKLKSTFSKPQNDIDLIKSYVDPVFYSNQTNNKFESAGSAAEHYLYSGWKSGLDPSSDFSTNYYLETYPDIVSERVNPLVHFLRHGWAENRVARSKEGFVTELLGYSSGKFHNMGIRPPRLASVFHWHNRISGLAVNFPEGINQIKILLNSKLIGTAKLQVEPGATEDIPNLERFTFEFYLPPGSTSTSNCKLLADGGDKRLSIESIPNENTHTVQAAKSLDEFFSLEYQSLSSSGLLPCSEALLQLFEEHKEKSRAQVKIEPPLVSVVMPAYNREHLISTAIKSVCEQSYRNWELIIVEDGSSDRTYNNAQLISRKLEISAKTKLIKLDRNLGVSFARNQALAKAAGKYIAYLDTDNSWDRDYLTHTIQSMEGNPNKECAYTVQSVYYHNQALNKNYIVGIRSRPFDQKQLYKENYIDLNAFIHTKSLYDTLGDFNESMRRLVDWELILRYTLNNTPLFIPALLCRYFINNNMNQITLNEDFLSNYTILKV